MSPRRFTLRLPRPRCEEEAIQRLTRQFGEGAVDDRGIDAIANSVAEHRTLVVEEEGEIVGTGSYFERAHHNNKGSAELGSLVLHERVRGLNLAPKLALARLTMILAQDRPVPILAEVYPSSMASLKMLNGLRFRMLDQVPFALHDAAWEANSARPVIYAVADPARYRRYARAFARFVEEPVTFGKKGSAVVTVDRELAWLTNHMYYARRPKFARHAFANDAAYGHGRRVRNWLSRYFGTPCLERSSFLAEKGRPSERWGIDDPRDLDSLASTFLRSLHKSETGTIG